MVGRSWVCHVSSLFSFIFVYILELIWLLYSIPSTSETKEITVKLLKITKHTFRKTTYSKAITFRFTMQHQYSRSSKMAKADSRVAPRDAQPRVCTVIGIFRLNYDHEIGCEYDFRISNQ